MVKKKKPQALTERKSGTSYANPLPSIISCYGKNYRQTDEDNEKLEKWDVGPTQIHSTALSMSPSDLSSSMPTNQTLKNENLNSK